MSKGDTHRGGRSVAKVELDNGTILYYKPHSLDKNIKYQELYNYLCRKTGISCRTVQYLSHDSYGWEEKIENIPCKNESEVEHYYFRMGIHLFLGYALGATDLHGENIIAHGEYPVIIDMETYPGYLKQQSEKDGSSVEKNKQKYRNKIGKFGYTYRSAPCSHMGQRKQQSSYKCNGNRGKDKNAV